MSLSKILRQSESREFLGDKIHNPGIEDEPETVIPPKAETPRRVGMAFDYALRGGLEGRYEEAVTRRLVAQEGLLRLQIGAVFGGADLDQAEIAKAEQRTERATDILSELGNQEDLPPDVARACYHLASMEVVYRAQRADQVTQDATDREIAELQELYSIVPWKKFNPTERLYLNPEFGEASRAVRGADADVVLDDVVVDVKTIKRQRPAIRMFRQLTGYALFARHYGLNEERDDVQIDQLGIYFSRAGELRTWPHAAVLEENAADEVLEYLLNYFQRG